MGRHTVADICRNVRHITITSKDPNAFWNDSGMPEMWSHNGWVWPGDCNCGDNQRLSCEVLTNGELSVCLIRQDPNWQNSFVLCSNEFGSVMTFLFDWTADISCDDGFIGPGTVDAVWQTM